jgi:D-alanyl-D-alanine carboxypeptidase
MENETLARIVSTRTITIGGRTMTNHNKLLSYMDGCVGLKTGYTKAAGRTLVSCAEKNGQRLIAVTLQDGNDWADHQALYEYGFSTYPAQRLAVLGQEIGRIPVQGAVQSTVPLVAADHFLWPSEEREAVESRVELDEPLTAPLIAGTKVGQAIFTLQGKEIGRVDLLCGESVIPSIESAWSILKLPD